MKVPESMRAELSRWNDGAGIDLDGWVSGAGNFSLAVGYSTIFCPSLIEFERYIFRADEMSEPFLASVRGFEAIEGSTRKSVEWVMNHFHLADLHRHSEDELSQDKIIIIGERLKDIYEARLAYLFPDRPCVVEFYRPEDPSELDDYQLSFWQS